MAIGFTLPFAKSTGSIGYFEVTTTQLEATRENLKSLLLTNWGERVMHYNFGCNLREFLFSNLSKGELKQRIADRIFDQVQKWMSFVSIDRLNIIFSDDDPSLPDHAILISIGFRINNLSDQTDQLSVVVA